MVRTSIMGGQCSGLRLCTLPQSEYYETIRLSAGSLDDNITYIPMGSPKTEKLSPVQSWMSPVGIGLKFIAIYRTLGNSMF